MIQTAVFGFGNIGGGVVEVMERNKEQISRSVPGGMAVKYILDIRDFPDSPYRDKVVHDIDIILNDPEIRVVCETMGGKEPAFTFSMRALEKGISVCTSNKELVEAHGPELLAAAKAHDCSYLFEASVGGGIPLISPMTMSLTQEEITSVVGILNGTTNYILTKMDRYGADYETVLKEAQALGYAERNPEADVEGHDTGRKIAILSSLMGGRTVKYDDIPVEGITRIEQADFDFARATGYVIRLLGVSRREPEGFHVLTAPHFVPEGHPLYAVDDVFNGVFIHGNMVDDLMFYGRGAGRYPTGSAVVADMIRAAKHLGKNIPILWDPEPAVLAPAGLRESVFFTRVDGSRADEALAAFEGKIAKKLGNVPGTDDFGFITVRMPDHEYEEICAGIGCVHNSIRVLA